MDGEDSVAAAYAAGRAEVMAEDATEQADQAEQTADAAADAAGTAVAVSVTAAEEAAEARADAAAARGDYDSVRQELASLRTLVEEKFAAAPPQTAEVEPVAPAPERKADIPQDGPEDAPGGDESGKPKKSSSGESERRYGSKRWFG